MSLLSIISEIEIRLERIISLLDALPRALQVKHEKLIDLSDHGWMKDDVQAHMFEIDDLVLMVRLAVSILQTEVDKLADSAIKTAPHLKELLGGIKEVVWRCRQSDEKAGVIFDHVHHQLVAVLKKSHNSPSLDTIVDVVVKNEYRCDLVPTTFRAKIQTLKDSRELIAILKRVAVPNPTTPSVRRLAQEFKGVSLV